MAKEMEIITTYTLCGFEGALCQISTGICLYYSAAVLLTYTDQQQLKVWQNSRTLQKKRQRSMERASWTALKSSVPKEIGWRIKNLPCHCLRTRLAARSVLPAFLCPSVTERKIILLKKFLLPSFSIFLPVGNMVHAIAVYAISVFFVCLLHWWTESQWQNVISNILSMSGSSWIY